MRLRLLRLVLFAAGLGWGISFLAVLLPLGIVEEGLKNFGAKGIPADPMLDYWMRMACGAFTLIGTLNLIFALNPKKYLNVIPLMGLLAVGEGIILIIHGLRLGLAPLPFYFDSLFCIGTGLAVFLLGRGLAKDCPTEQSDRTP